GAADCRTAALCRGLLGALSKAGDRHDSIVGAHVGSSRLVRRMRFGDTVETKLLFVIGPPRSGSTLLMRMLSSHSAIYSRAEPHLLTPLAHLGFYDTVERAPFDHLQAQGAVREFVAELPRGEEDYLDACRGYTDFL